ncbi:alpha/beta-hydrolase [Tothia fuscella]|uniref:triacylglycerol lipase n=1 Tax=Tothia fuscella TaxID=1048955 RepID=A0A9P4NL19_9PEZI|nr:alpha/beta-hydrolase [Tothia fuscella]
MLQTITQLLLPLLLLSPSPATAAIHQHSQRREPSFLPDGPLILPGLQDVLAPPPETAKNLEFTLRHIYHHGTHKYPNLHRRLDVPKDATIWTTQGDSLSLEPVPKLTARLASLSIQRLVDRSHDRIDSLLDAGRMRGKALALDASEWTVDELPGPNITDKETVLSMARIAANAYVAEHSDAEWLDVGGGFNYTEDFGWENDGLRGHIFADTENSTVVIGLKGTTPAVFDGSDTTTNDKINDNLFFSCCCGQGGHLSWRQVCDCQTSAYKCNSTCVVEALRNKNRYYYAAREIYRNATLLYPNANFWLSGHSLGGSTSSLVALTYGIPVVTFEAPGEAMPAQRLGLPTPPGYSIGEHQKRPITGGFHFGHTADPIYMGTCNTLAAVCTIAGYAMQSRCHTGGTCTYDTVKDLGWRSSSSNHRIVSVIKDVIEKYDAVAACKPMVNCTDCYNWEYFEGNHTDKPITKTSSSTSTSQTRTSTCKTPGWWGCLDETTVSTSTTTTTSTSTTTTLTTTTTTTMCETPGWFGCNDEKKSAPPTVSTTRPLPAPTMTTSHGKAPKTSTCATPGWLGCNDPVETITKSRTATVTSIVITTTTDSATMIKPTHTSVASSSCSKKWFGFICAKPETTSTPAPSAAPTSRLKEHCARRSLLGRCKDWVQDGEWRVDL